MGKNLNNLIKKYFYESNNFSIKHEKYFSVYEKLLSRYKDKEITLVEIGIHNGGSLYIWKKFLPKAKVIGIDLNEDCRRFEKDGFIIEIGDQNSEEFWKNFFKKHGNVDVIIDDGGHTNSQQINTAICCIPNLNNGGLLITEDVMCSYIFEFGNPNKFSFISFSKKIIDDINFKFPKTGKFKYSLNDYVYSIQFFESIVVFEIDRNLCYFNNTVTNDKKNHNIKDLRYNLNIEDLFQKNFFKKFKILRKINEYYRIIKIRNLNNKNLKKFKKFFK